MSTLRRVLEIEKDEILEWLHEYDTLGLVPIKLMCFRWKEYEVEWHGDFLYTVNPPSSQEKKGFETWEHCLNYIMEEVFKKYG